MLKLKCDCPSCRARVLYDFAGIVSASYSRREVDYLIAEGRALRFHDPIEDVPYLNTEGC